MQQRMDPCFAVQCLIAGQAWWVGGWGVNRDTVLMGSYQACTNRNIHDNTACIIHYDPQHVLLIIIHHKNINHPLAYIGICMCTYPENKMSFNKYTMCSFRTGCCNACVYWAVFAASGLARCAWLSNHCRAARLVSCGCARWWCIPYGKSTSPSNS